MARWFEGELLRNNMRIAYIKEQKKFFKVHAWMSKGSSLPHTSRGGWLNTKIWHFRSIVAKKVFPPYGEKVFLISHVSCRDDWRRKLLWQDEQHCCRESLCLKI